MSRVQISRDIEQHHVARKPHSFFHLAREPSWNEQKQMDVCNRFLAPFVPFAISLNCFEYLHRFIFLIFLQHSGCVGLMGLFGVGMCMAVSVCWRCWASVADRWGFLSFPLCREITDIEVHFMVVFSNKG